MATTENSLQEDLLWRVVEAALSLAAAIDSLIKRTRKP